MSLYIKRERTALQEKSWSASTITQLSVTWSGTYITYYPGEGMRPQEHFCNILLKIHNLHPIKKKETTQTEAFATKSWALSIKVLTVPEGRRLKRHDNLVPHMILGRVVLAIKNATELEWGLRRVILALV